MLLAVSLMLIMTGKGDASGSSSSKCRGRGPLFVVPDSDDHCLHARRLQVTRAHASLRSIVVGYKLLASGVSDGYESLTSFRAWFRVLQGDHKAAYGKLELVHDAGVEEASKIRGAGEGELIGVTAPRDGMSNALLVEGAYCTFSSDAREACRNFVVEMQHETGMGAEQEGTYS